MRSFDPSHLTVYRGSLLCIYNANDREPLPLRLLADPNPLAECFEVGEIFSRRGFVDYTAPGSEFVRSRLSKNRPLSKATSRTRR